MDFLSPINADENEQTKHHFFNVRNLKNNPLSGFSGPGIGLITLESPFAQNVRKNFDLLQNHFKNITIYDLGFIRNADNDSIQNVIDLLHKQDIIPVIIGINYETIKSLSLAAHSNLYYVANRLPNAAHSDFSFNYLAFQRHLCALSDIFSADEYLYNSLSLGKIRSFPSLLEPVMRDTQLLFTDLNCVRRSDVPNISDSLPTGLHAEELCQMMKYAGTAHNVKALFFNEPQNIIDNSQESLLTAEAVWYFIEGLNMRVREHPSVSTDFSEFVIYSHSFDHDLIFKRNNQTLKWWLSDQSIPENTRYLACAYEEYEKASGGDEIPERLLKFLQQGKE